MSTRDEFLVELSTILGFPVLDVRRVGVNWSLQLPCTPSTCFCRWDLPYVERQGLPHSWMPPFPHDVWRSFGRSADFRNPRRLNVVALRYGRPSRLGPLVAEDGRRIVRLMYDISLPREV